MELWHSMTTRLLPAFLVLSSTLSAAGADSGRDVDFARQILPILSNKCFVCHGPDAKDEEQLRLDSFEGATSDRGGYRAIDPDSPEASALLARIHDPDNPMPPVESDKQLTKLERELLSRWIRQGGRYAVHWAFLPPSKSPPSKTLSAKTLSAKTLSAKTLSAKLEQATGSEVIDAFVEERLSEANTRFAPQADPATLARRAALVLTGLPPEPEQLSRFLADERADAYERLVDELLASPRFGEHQARYWLDAVRYGDTHGLHLDNRRGIYPYRDWVVHAFNQNLPLNDFITWQLAGDLLPDPTLEQLVATGFVRMNPTTAEGGAIPDEFQAKNNFDRTETLGTVLLGMSLTCARCHSHKYDPIPQTEYYRLLAFFNSTAEHSMDGNSYTYGPVAKAPPDLATWREWQALEAEQAELLAKAETEFAPTRPDDERARWAAGDRTQRLRWLRESSGKFAKPAQVLADRLAEAEKRFTTTLVARDLPNPRVTRILRRGEYDQPIGDPLEPGVLTVMGAFPADAPRNRLGLARWLTAREHPLVARVLVNQIWQRTFGEGLVRTPEDFGLQGEQPTHPELLDWLAVELHDSDWDLKHMLRLMVTSRTFRQSSARRPDVDDPENRLLARGPSYRLDAEVIRDQALWASGLLAPAMGGEGVKPYQPEGLWKALAHPASNTKQYERDQGEKLYHRSLYVYWKRTSPHPMMTLFDAPSREASCVRRSRTNTSLQSLALFNETQRVEMSRALAQRLLLERPDDAQRLDMLFRMLACREPTDMERSVCEKLLATLRGRFRGAEDDALALLATGEAARDDKLDPADHAAWAQLAATVLASDVAITLY